MEDLKGCLTQSPILAFPREKGALILDTDASDTGLGAVLSQMQEDGKERVISYASRSLNRPERNYCVTRRELLAIVFGVRKFRHYLTNEFTVRTDHHALQWLLSFKEPEGQMARWLVELSTYHMDVEPRPGRAHGNADGLSRIPCRQCGRPEELLSPGPKAVLPPLQMMCPVINDRLAPIRLAIGRASCRESV